MDHTSTSAVFRADYSIDSVTTSDSGTYTCAVTNPIGSDSATITVTIVGMYVGTFTPVHLYIISYVVAKNIKDVPYNSKMARLYFKLLSMPMQTLLQSP